MPRTSRYFHAQSRGRSRSRATKSAVAWGELRLALLLGAALGLAYTGLPSLPEVQDSPSLDTAHPYRASFGLCDSGFGSDCVVDGDTFRMDGDPIRVADIDTPETHPARCAEEARLGDAATRRLRDLLNAGPFELQPIERDVDRYGRKLRVVMREGHSLGDVLVAEGLARTWTGRREPWCR